MNTEPAPYYQQQAQPKKKRLSGCLTALLIFLALGLVTMVIGAFVAWKLYQNPAVQSAVDAVVELPNAPGRAELERAGCQNAMVMDLRALGKLAEGSKEPSEDIEALKDSVMIVCLAPPTSALTCPQIATTYAAAVPRGANRLHIQLQRVAKEPALCRGIYDRTGTYLGVSHFEQHGSDDTDDSDDAR